MPTSQRIRDVGTNFQGLSHGLFFDDSPEKSRPIDRTGTSPSLKVVASIRAHAHIVVKYVWSYFMVFLFE